ncbi:MAG TPA: DUF4129 domain-containing protein [Actinomycetota bacterium]|nr:DUF4129 domain-containing protein [Actinomycetota bacterium]
MRSNAPAGRVAAAVASGLLALSLLAFGVPSSRASVTVSAPGFLERIERARTLAETGERQPRPAIMESVRDALGLPATLTMSDSTLELRSDVFLEALRGDDATDFSLAIHHLDVIASEVGGAAREPALDPELLDRRLQQAYTGLRPLNPLQRFGAWVRGLLSQVLDVALTQFRAFNGVGSVLAWIVVAGVATLVVLVLRRLGLGLVPERAARTGASSATETDWERIADDALRRNDLREATRALFHVLVATLAAQRVLTGTPSTTAGECRTAVARSVPGLYPSVSKATDAFERVVYGGAHPALSDVEAIRVANREAAR